MKVKKMTEAEATKEVIHWAQAVLTALNVGDIQSESLIHKKLREVMIAYRVSLPCACKNPGDVCQSCMAKLATPKTTTQEPK